tara:strand:- start:118 stop:1944 length:1827 start_codon:yes stop_codon:yes gene_type:complete
MSTRTLTINHANGSSETYNIKTEDVLGVRSMQVDGETVTIDRTAPANIRSIIADGETITIDTTREGVRTLIVDGETITIDRFDELDEMIDLAHSFPVTVHRSSQTYSIKETGSDYLNTFSGSTIYVSPSGSDSTGDGSVSAPYETLDVAIANTSSGGNIELAAGIYATPVSSITKDLAFTCPSGKAYIGTFSDLVSESITTFPNAWGNYYKTTIINGNTVSGLLRTDGVKLGEVRGSAKSSSTSFTQFYQENGIMSVRTGNSSSNITTGTSETLQELVATGSVLAWTKDSTTMFGVNSSATVYIGQNITIASYATDVIGVSASSTLILDGCEIYGGSNSTIEVTNSATLIQFDTLVSGSEGDNIDYRDQTVGVESNIVSNWCNTGVSDNTSTAHGDAELLRVGGTYRGGSRTVHDVNNTVVYVLSCNIGDALHNDKALLLIGSSSSGVSKLTYGDVTFLDTFNDGGLTNLTVDTLASAVQKELDDEWLDAINQAFINTGYESFTNSTVSGFTASNTTSAGFAVSPIANGLSGDTLQISFDLAITNGSPTISLRTLTSGGSTASTGSTTYTSSGSYTTTLIASQSYQGVGFTEGNTPSNFTVSNFQVTK